jgi:hypothetical protein
MKLKLEKLVKLDETSTYCRHEDSCDIHD